MFIEAIPRGKLLVRDMEVFIVVLGRRIDHSPVGRPFSQASGPGVVFNRRESSEIAPTFSTS